LSKAANKENDVSPPRANLGLKFAEAHTLGGPTRIPWLDSIVARASAEPKRRVVVAHVLIETIETNI